MTKERGQGGRRAGERRGGEGGNERLKGMMMMKVGIG